MANIESGCYSCARNCINDQFCEQNGSISLPKQLKIVVIANPNFWGFDDGNGNILTSGTAIFSNGHYDFFDGYDQYHFATKECTPSPVEGPYKNEQRPDVLYRTVLDPEDPSLGEYSGRRHYGVAGTVDNINRGGGEVYLIDRPATKFTDLESCDTADPTSVYKKFPENYGYGTKISLTDTVFKNKTGAWRYIDLDDCNTTIVDTGIVSECDRTPKQEILRGATYGTQYDPFQIRVSGNVGCVGDGYMPTAYTGVSTFHRNSGEIEFIEMRPKHDGVFASGLKEGSVLGLYGEYINATHTIFNLTSSGCHLIGTLGSGYINETGLNYWTALGTYDPESCCGGVAYNVSNDTKRPNNITNYHADLGRIFNNSKNVIQSNRFIENRYDYGFGQPVVEEPANTIRTDKSYPSVSDTGVPLEGGFPVFERQLPYYGAFYETDRHDTSTRSDGRHNTTKGNNQTCYSKKSSLSIFPDCFTQKYGYTACPTDGGGTKYLTNQSSRLALVYRGCNYEDECNFNASGHPYTTPTSVDDLKRGLAGQEIYMYINLDMVWGAHFFAEACACEDPIPEGEKAPEDRFIEILSPVTFPTFPKFDLYPEDYGCNDLLWQYKWASECEGAILNECPIPSSLYACLPKQPYTTYGFIRNLCGNEYHDRRQVITSAFATLVQDGDYRNTGVAPTTPQPMYWNHLNPYTHESGAIGGVSASGNYPFWGLSDADGRLVAPYFRTKTTTYTDNCGGTTNYLDFDLCATRASGWPTSSVPFLVKIDHTDDCIGCGSIEATQGNLILEAAGLDTKFSHARGEKYGWSHCKYKGTSFDATYTCESGFNIPCTGLVTGTDLLAAYNPYVGNTCSCMNNTFSLQNIPLRGTNISAGWTTWNINNSYINVPNCAQDHLNDYFSDVPTERFHGFSVYASFKLACDNAHQFLIPADATGILKNYLVMSQIDGAENVLDLMYQNAGCGHHFPSAASDLTLKAGFILVPSGNEGIFEIIPEHLLTSLGAGLATPATVLAGLADNHVFGCNTYFSEYGCASQNAYGQASFYPCGYCNSGDPTMTPICECDGITCDACNNITSSFPNEYKNSCLCDCNLQLMRKTLIDFDGNETLIYSTGVLCDSVGGPTSGVVVAVSYSGEYGSIGITYLNANDQIPFASNPVYVTAESACSWHTGPNMLTTGVYYEYEEPYRLVSGTESCDTLIPELCTGDCANDPQARAGSCGDPIPWSGVAVNSGVVVNLRSCFPEVMIVNKIECSYNSFNLYVAREYHTHGRNWEQSGLVSAVSTCIPKQIGAYRYGATCVEVPFATPTDAVTPAYYSVPVTGIAGTGSYRGVCNAHYSSGIHASQDFILSETPVAVGEDKLWNYFNLFYESGYPSSKYFPAIDLGDPTADPVIPKDACGTGISFSDTSIFPSGRYTTPVDRFGVDWTNQFHSCLQDYVECGADFYCNKMFFPRRKYAVGTKVSRFGSLQLCTSHSSLVHGDWYTGYDDFDATEMPDDFIEAENTRFIHACDETIKTTTGSGVGIDDVVINVVDYLPLIGINTSLFRYELSVKNCTIISSGDCHILNTHSDLSVDGGIHAPKTFLIDGRTSMGYYLDKTTFEESDNCLFNPFKILVDVECCESVLRRREIQSDPPTMLEYILDGVPSVACGGFIKQPPCSCGSSTCGGATSAYYELHPKPVCVTLAKHRASYWGADGTATYTKCETTDCTECCDGSGDGTATAVIANTGVVTYGYSTTGGSVAYEIGANAGIPVGCKTLCNRATPLSDSYEVCDGSDGFISNEDVVVPAYQCGDYLYIAAVVETGCCTSTTLCGVLSSSWKIRVGDCTILRPSGIASHIDDYLNDCGCLDANRYTSCETSLLHATITEA